MPDMKIGLEDLDYNIKSVIKNHAFIKVNVKFNRSSVTFEEFKQVLDEGLRELIEKSLKEFYSFCPSVQFTLTDEDYYTLHVG